MNSAILHNGQVVLAKEYNAEVHGNRIYCIDKSCKAPVIFVPGGENIAPHFKTTGKNASKHAITCGFFKPLSFAETIEKVEEYQNDFLERGLKETIVRLNLNKIDPDYEPRTIEREENKDKKTDTDKIKIKEKNETPASIGSLKSVVKLITSYEPDILSSILVNVKGKKIPISSLIVNQEKAHDLLWNGGLIPNINYFVYGVIETVLRREKVIYINFKPVNKILFSLIVFDKYFKYFTYRDEELIGKQVLAWGVLQKNTYKEKNTTEMAIKSDRYIEIVNDNQAAPL